MNTNVYSEIWETFMDSRPTSTQEQIQKLVSPCFQPETMARLGHHIEIGTGRCKSRNPNAIPNETIIVTGAAIGAGVTRVFIRHGCTS